MEDNITYLGDGSLVSPSTVPVLGAHKIKEQNGNSIEMNSIPHTSVNGQFTSKIKQTSPVRNTRNLTKLKSQNNINGNKARDTAATSSLTRNKRVSTKASDEPLLQPLLHDGQDSESLAGNKPVSTQASSKHLLQPLLNDSNDSEKCDSTMDFGDHSDKQVLSHTMHTNEQNSDGYDDVEVQISTTSDSHTPQWGTVGLTETQVSEEYYDICSERDDDNHILVSGIPALSPSSQHITSSETASKAHCMSSETPPPSQKMTNPAWLLAADTESDYSTDSDCMTQNNDGYDPVDNVSDEVAHYISAGKDSNASLDDQYSKAIHLDVSSKPNKASAPIILPTRVTPSNVTKTNATVSDNTKSVQNRENRVIVPTQGRGSRTYCDIPLSVLPIFTQSTNVDPSDYQNKTGTEPLCNVEEYESDGSSSEDVDTSGPLPPLVLPNYNLVPLANTSMTMPESNYINGRQSQADSVRCESVPVMSVHGRSAGKGGSSVGDVGSVRLSMTSDSGCEDEQHLPQTHPDRYNSVDGTSQVNTDKERTVSYPDVIYPGVSSCDYDTLDSLESNQTNCFTNQSKLYPQQISIDSGHESVAPDIGELMNNGITVQ